MMKRRYNIYYKKVPDSVCEDEDENANSYFSEVIFKLFKKE
jgi:hypothetical protein